MHDRRIDGTAHIFGNSGGLFMNAMVWWDHETESLWAQPWGRAIEGELEGVELFILPSQLTTFGAWQAQHPHTLVMTNDLDRLGARRQTFTSDFVVGLLLDGESRAYYVEDVLAEDVINDVLDDVPILVAAEGEQFHAYVRQVDEQILTFANENGRLTDVETGSEWDIVRGLAVAGELAGEALRPVPSSSTYDWAWRDFYPEVTFFGR